MLATPLSYMLLIEIFVWIDFIDAPTIIVQIDHSCSNNSTGGSRKTLQDHYLGIFADLFWV